MIIARMDTWSVLQELSARIPELRPLRNEGPGGLGSAIRWGLERYTGDRVTIMMADLSDDPRDLVQFNAEMDRCESDCVFGSRAMPGAEVSGYPTGKWIANRLANWFLCAVFQYRYNDTTNPFKLYSRSLMERILPLRSSGFELEIEDPAERYRARGQLRRTAQPLARSRSRRIQNAPRPADRTVSACCWTQSQGKVDPRLNRHGPCPELAATVPHHSCLADPSWRSPWWARSYLFRNEVSWDETTYMGLATGLSQGTFSYWVGHFDPPPIETYRTQGYPAFLLLLRTFSASTFTVKLVQMLLQFLVLVLLSRAIEKWGGGPLTSNSFLLIALPQLQLLYYTQLVYPETLMSFLITAAVIACHHRQRSTAAVVHAGRRPGPRLLGTPGAAIASPVHSGRRPADRSGRTRRWNACGRTCRYLCFSLSSDHCHSPSGTCMRMASSGLSPSPAAASFRTWVCGSCGCRGYGSMHYFSFNYFGREAISLRER